MHLPFIWCTTLSFWSSFISLLMYWENEQTFQETIVGLQRQNAFDVCVCVCVHACALNHVWLFVTPMDYIAHQATLHGFPRQEYCSGSPFSTPGGFPNPEIKPTSLMSPVLAGRFFTTGTTRLANVFDTWGKLWSLIQTLEMLILMLM